jgi:hypothetical protein
MNSEDNEFAAAARRVLRRLALGAAWLEPLADGDYALRMRGKPMGTRVAASLVGEMRKRGWLSARAEAPGSFVLSDAGEGWFIRMQNVSDPFAAQHQLRARRLMATPEGEKTVLVNDGESTLGWLKKRRIVDAVQYDAGERLRRDFTLAGLSPRMGIDWEAPVVLSSRVNRGIVISDMALAAKQRFAAAMRSVGPGLSDLLFDICCHLTGLEDAERAKGWPRRSAKVVLQIALDRLAMHYGMRAPSRGKVRAWRGKE